MNKEKLDFSKVDVSKTIEGINIHKKDVSDAMNIIQSELTLRANSHDDDKMKNADKWARFQLLDAKGYKFGTPEHKKFKKQLGIKETIDEHTDNNRHHPEFFNRDLSKMNIIDITEMIVDWYAASTRRASGKGVSFEEMMEFQQTRFNMSDELKGILLNTLNKIRKIQNNE